MLRALPDLPDARTHRQEETAALLELVKRLRRLDWPRGLVASCAGFHIAAAVILGLFPYDVVLTEGTKPVLDMAPRQVWALVFLVLAAAVTLLRRDRAQWLVNTIWLAVLSLGGLWLTAFGLAVFRGEGSALGLAVWPFLYGPWLFAIRSLGKR